MRGSVLLASLLILWWVVLQNPLLYLLRTAAGSFFHIAQTAAGDWSVEVPIEATVPQTPDHAAPVRVHSIDFYLARLDLGAFTFGLPVLWAIMLAASERRRWLRPLILGTVAMACMEVFLFSIWVQIFAQRTALQWPPSPSPFANWFCRFAEYLTVIAIPYVAPFVLAICLHRDLRTQMFGWISPSEPARLTAN